MVIEKKLKKSLLIISDTPFYQSERVTVFEPTLREIEEISDVFSKISWISYKRIGLGEKNARLPLVHNLKLFPIKDARGGESAWQKLLVVLSIPWQTLLFYRHIITHDVIHTRGPSVPALIVAVLSFFDSKRIYWYKYAGNWNELNSPVSFRLQRWVLSKLNKPNVRITINGKWKGLHKGFMFMENPCFKSSYLNAQKQVFNSRNYGEGLRVCFVGNLAPFKGAVRLVQALLSHDIVAAIDSIWIVGDGEEHDKLKNIASSATAPIHLCGYLSREEIFSTIYSKCHLLVLPSETEGFPKVVAEAAVHKCIPVVTRVSAIDQYIEDGVNGFLLTDSSIESLKDTFIKKIILNKKLKEVANKAQILAEKFTYERFKFHVENEILADRKK